MSAQPTTPGATPDTVTIEIDGNSMSVPKGSMIIQAADKAGIPIPRFCYHEKLSIAANCRMCLVDVEKAPKPMPACATPVMDGMKVYTQSKRALDSQRNVMEFLLINHPLDCPICDQGGECELQDVALGYGRSVSRFVEKKRVVADEDIGPLVATDMTRCIHCTRCVRFVAEIAGTYELGGMGRGEALQIGTYIGKNINSELSGNIIDVCPVGALTNKPFRYRARPWELIARDGIGYHDALGGNLHLHLRNRDVLRTVPRANEAINETWASDRDRYSHTGLAAADRVTRPMVHDGDSWREVDWNQALARAAELLRAVPGDALGMLVHPATSNEEGALLAALAAGLGCTSIDHRIGVQDFADAPVAEPFEATLADIEQAGAILLIGCNPRLEAPLLGHRVRKAWKAGARISAVNPVDFEMNFDLASKRIVAPGAMVDVLLGIARALGNDSAQTPSTGMADALGAAVIDDGILALANSIRDVGTAVVLVGESALSHPQASWLRALARHIAACIGGRVDFIPQGANAVGLAAHGVLPSGQNAAQQLAQPRRGYLLYGIEPQHDFVDNAAALQAFSHAETVVAFAAYAPDALRRVARVILPIGLLPEIDATLTNAMGQKQRVGAAARLPGEARPGWRVLRALGEALGVAGFDFVDLAEFSQRMHGAPARSGSGLAARSSRPVDGLQRVATRAIYRSDAVVRRAAPLNAHPLTRGPGIDLHPEDALAIGLSDGAMAHVDDGRGRAALPVRISLRAARGSAWIEAGYEATAPLAPTGAALTVSKA
jgi:NADH-quinone oxidoreductase subunit G